MVSLVGITLRVCRHRRVRSLAFPRRWKQTPRLSFTYPSIMILHQLREFHAIH